MVVQPPSIQQVFNLSTRDCDPVNMAAVRGAADSLLPGVVEVMESAAAQSSDDVEVVEQLGMAPNFQHYKTLLNSSYFILT